MSDSTIKALEAGTGGTDLGAIAVTQGATPVKIGKQTVVDQTGAEVPFAKDATVSAVTTSLGTDGGQAPANGTGVRGWLRSIYDRLTAGLGRTWTLSNSTDSVNVGNFPATQPVSGTVTVAQATAGNLNATVTGTVQANNLVGGTAVSNANPLPISDAGGSLTVDGSVTATLAAGTQSIGNIGTVATITNPVAVTDNGGSLTVDGTITANQGTAGASPWPVSDGGGSLTVDGSVNVGNFPATQNVAITGVGASPATPIYAFERPADLKVKQVSAANAAQTVTLPAVAGQFHYIVGIIVQRYNSTATAVAGAAANLAVTTTNLGGLEFRFGNAVAAGAGDTPVNLQPSNPLKSDTVNTATTVVVPALGAGIISVVNVIYFTAP